MWGVVLAAGLGSRFEGDRAKLLAGFRGRPLIQHVVETLTAARRAGSLAGEVAVVPPGDETMARAIRESGAVMVENPDPSRGLSTSLALGIERLEDPVIQPEPAAALIVLGDQPLVGLDVIAGLVDAWRAGADIVRPVYDDAPSTPGHPVLVDRGRWPLLDGLAGDRGLGEVLSAHSDWVTILPVPGTNPDIDTTADLAALEDTP